MEKNIAEAPKPKTAGRIGWIDFLRVAACLLVVLAHCCDPFVAAFDSDRAAFLTGAFAGSLVRCCVPLFVMMTGVLLLPVREGLGAFYRKRLGRILWALLFWSLVLPVAYWLYMRWVGTSSPSADPALFTGEATLRKLWTWLLNFTYDTTPLWYLYMLAGLYLAMPVVSPWLERASKHDLRILLGVWGATLLLPYAKLLAPALGYAGNYGNMGLYGVCDWNEFGTFHYVSGFAGYLLLAHYFAKFPPRCSTRRLLAATVPMFLAGYVVTAGGFLAMQRLAPGNYAALEVMWYFSGLNVFLMTLPVFLWAQRLTPQPRPWLGRLAGLTFGIFLCHFIFVQAAYDLTAPLGLPPVVRIPLMCAVAFAASWLAVRLLDTLPPLRRFIR